MKSVTDRTREALYERPALVDALEAGVLNLSATARHLELDDADPEAIATALRRLRDEIDRSTPTEPDRVRIDQGDTDIDTDISVADRRANPAADGTAAIRVEGIDATHHRRVIDRLQVRSIPVHAAGYVDDTAIYHVPRDATHAALRACERATPGATSIHSSAGRNNRP